MKVRATGQDRRPSGPKGQVQARPPARTPARAAPDHRPGPRKRGWRDIEALSERARLKKLLSDIWHEDIELEEDIFGESDHLAGYYTDSDEEEIPAEPDEEVEFEDFEEDED